MTTSTTPSTSAEVAFLDPELRRARVVRDLEAMAGLREMLLELSFRDHGQEVPYYEDLELELDRAIPPLYVSPIPNRETRRKLGIYFDPAEVRRFLEFALRCRHSKGELGGKRLRLDLWQVLYVVGPVFGWRQSGGARYFRELFLEVPRKNGKSTLAAALALFLLMADSNLAAGRRHEPGAEVYAAATTKAQAKNVFEPAVNMVKASPWLAGRLNPTGDVIAFESTLSRFELLSGDPSKAEEKMGGNVSGAVIDETHVHRDARLIGTIESGTVSRSQPLVCHLTTAGADTSGTIYAEKHDFAVAIAEGKVLEVRTWAVIYTIPDELRGRWDEPEVWQGANPGLGISVSIEYLENEVRKGKRIERKRLEFMRLHLNVRTETVTRWLDVRLYDVGARQGASHLPEVAPYLRGMVAYGGLDLSSRVDLSALALVVPRWVPDPDEPGFEIEVLETVLRGWIPKDSIDRRPARERELFSRWLEEGWLRPCNGETIDLDAIELEIYHLAEELEIERLSFDRWGSRSVVNNLRSEGVNVFELGQGFAGMSPAMKALEGIVAEGRLWTGGNPLLRYAVENLSIERDAAGNIKPNRDKSTGHVDPLVAVAMAVDGYERSLYVESAYEEGGLTVA